MVTDSGYVLEKIEGVGKIPDNVLSVTADVVGLYPNISHKCGLSALEQALNKKTVQKIPTDSLVKMADFDLSNNYLNLMKGHSNKSPEQLQVINLPHLMRAFI